jgi:hypothetical protein
MFYPNPPARVALVPKTLPRGAQDFIDLLCNADWNIRYGVARELITLSDLSHFSESPIILKERSDIHIVRPITKYQKSA